MRTPLSSIGLARGRKQKNLIDHLEKEDDVVIKEDCEIEEEVINYFTSLYAPPVFARPFLDGLN